MTTLSNQQPSSNNIHKSKKAQGNRKLTKADIGTPSNFKHVTHVGWNAKSGFDLSGEDESLRPFLQKAGISENQLKDQRTRDFIYSFIETNNVEELMRKEQHTKSAAPPVPNRPAQKDVPHEVKNIHGEKRIAPARPPPLPQKDYSPSEKKAMREMNKQQPPPPPPLPMTTPPVRKQITANAPQPPPPPMMVIFKCFFTFIVCSKFILFF